MSLPIPCPSESTSTETLKRRSSSRPATRTPSGARICPSMPRTPPGAGRVDVGALGSGHPPGEPDSAGREALSPAAGVPLVSMRPLTTPFSLGEASRVGHVGEHLVRPPVHLCGRCRHFGPPRSNGAARPPRYMGEPWGPSTPSQPHTILRRGGLPELGEVTTPGSFVSKPQV
jgi:hypothetical protein